MDNTVTAQSHWVWTLKAQEEEPKRHIAGEMVWPQYAKEAPRKWLEDGLILDSNDYVKEGQTEIFDFM